MALASQIAHRNVRNTNFPYRTNVSPTETDPMYVTGSQDLLTSIKGYAERRPGFANNVETTPTTFVNLQRLFTWDRFDGTFIEMACDINASNFAVVYKRIVGGDNSFVSIFTDTGSATPFDFVVSNNTIYFSNGHVAKAWEPTNGIRNWGISVGSINSSVGPTIAGAGADGGGPIVWSNPNNVTSAVSSATATIPTPGGDSQTNSLNATQFGFSIAPTSTIIGIQITLDCSGTSSGAVNASLSASMLKGGSTIGTVKSTNTSGTISFGGNSDLWGTTWTPNDINQTTFGISFNGFYIASLPPINPVTFSVKNVKITIFQSGGPVISLSGSAGSFSANIGYQYVFCYGNSNSGHVSSPTLPSLSTGQFGGLISTSVVAAGGSGYAVNDTGIISSGNFNAKYTVNSVTGGAVTTYTISAAGTGYIVSNNVSTAIAGTQPGAGSGFTINITAITGILNVQISLVASTDTQVNQIRVFRSTDSVPLGANAGVYFELPTSPYPNTTANITDNATDSSLIITQVAPIAGFNDPPTPFRGPVYFAGRIWGFKDNQVFYSGLEEILLGVPEESFISGVGGNFWSFDQSVNGLGVAGMGINQVLLILCGGRIYAIVGDSNDTFARLLISNRRGCRNLTCVTSIGGMVAWLDSSSQIWVTDGSSSQEVSIDIRPDLAALSPTGCSMTFHVSGTFHWLLLSTPANLFVYDIDMQQWMPPWSIIGKYIYSGETSPGSYQLMLSTGTKAIMLSTTSHNDNGNTYTPIAKTNLFSVIPDFGKRFSYAAMGLYDEPTRTGFPTHVQIDTNAVTLGNVLVCYDDDPLNTSTVYTSIVGNSEPPDVVFNRGQGQNIVQNIYTLNEKSSRWVGIQFQGQNADDTLKIYQFFIGYKVFGGR